MDRWWRNLAAAGSVLVIILSVCMGLPMLERVVPVDRNDIPQRQEVAAGVTVVPPIGSLLSKRLRPEPDEGSILFLVGPARYVVAVSPFDGDLEAATVRLRTKIQSMRGYQVTSPEHEVTTRTGLHGLGSTFTAPGRSGRYVAFVAPGHAIEVTINSSETDFQRALNRIDESVASISHGDPP